MKFSAPTLVRRMTDSAAREYLKPYMRKDASEDLTCDMQTSRSGMHGLFDMLDSYRQIRLIIFTHVAHKSRDRWYRFQRTIHPLMYGLGSFHHLYVVSSLVPSSLWPCSEVCFSEDSLLFLTKVLMTLEF